MFMTLSYQPRDLGLHEVLVHVEIERNQRVVGERDAFRLLRAARGAARRRPARRGVEQRVVRGARVVRQVDAEVALQVLRKRIGIVVVAGP